MSWRQYVHAVFAHYEEMKRLERKQRRKLAMFIYKKANNNMHNLRDSFEEEKRNDEGKK
jgi:hypothetical protein